MAEVGLRTKWIYGPLVAAMAMALSLAGLELGARAFIDGEDIPFPQPKDSGYGRCVEPDLSRGYAPVPGACDFNEHGYLGPVLPPKGESPGPEPFRILLAGDSIGALGYWVAQLEAGLQAELGREVVIFNGAVSGYNLCQDWMTLRELAPLTEPDLLLVQSCTNDVLGSLVLRPTSRGGLVMDTGGGGTMRLPGAILHSRFLTFLAVRYGASKMSDRLAGGRHIEDATRCLAGVRDLALQLKVPARVLLFPELVDPGELGFQEALHQEATIQERAEFVGLTVISLRSVLEGEGGMARFRPGEHDRIHPNQVGQDMIVQGMLSELVSLIEGSQVN